MPPSLTEVIADLTIPGRPDTWRAQVRPTSGVIEAQTRMRSIHLIYRRDPDAGKPLLAGAYVDVAIPGRSVENLLRLPESAMTRDGELWLVDADDRLVRRSARPVFSSDGFVFVSAPQGPDSGTAVRIASHPLASFVEGRRVAPRAPTGAR